MEEKLVVFDMDDVMYNLNERVAELKGIDPKKFTQFGVYTNPNMTEEEKQKVLAAYTEAETYTGLTFIKPVIDLINCVHHEFPMFPVHIVSNCAAQAVKDAKLPQLLEVLDLPQGRIHLNVIDMKTESLRKKFPDNMLMIVDDSPHNIKIADAKYKIMPARLHNENILVDGMLDGEHVERPKTPGQFSDFVLRTLWFESHRPKQKGEDV